MLGVAPFGNSAQYFGSWSYYDNYYYYSCSSSSTSLTNCSRVTAPSSSYCDSNDHAGLWCRTVPPAGMYNNACDNRVYHYPTMCPDNNHVVSQHCADGMVRLMGGQSSREGRLEYCYHGLWSPFCYINYQTATVACKQLGFINSPSKCMVIRFR